MVADLFIGWDSYTFQKLQTFSWLRLYYLYENADLEIGGKFLPKFSHKCD